MEEVLQYLGDHGDTGVIISLMALMVEWLRRRLNRCDRDHAEALVEIRRLNDRFTDFFMKGN